ncbi:MAG: phosphatase PAP2 family protein [Alphaproteobacteria bacterium]|nr:phosphatase PAP2 family protein [Alphaproteobacteria bacterium]
MSRTAPGFAILLSAILVCMVWLDRDVALVFGAMKQQMPAVIAPFQVITTLGKSMWYLYPLGLYSAYAAIMLRLRPSERTLWLSRLQISLFIFANVALSGLTVDIIKILAGRPRPVILLEEGIFNQFTPFVLKSRWWSFPSGHSVTALSLALAASLFWPRWRWALLACAGLVGASRVIVTAHYPSDVIGGFTIAVIVFMGLTRLFEVRGWTNWRKEKT